MSELINGRTPEEIKAAIRDCENWSCDDCPYADVLGCGDAIQRDALALIERLEAAQPRWISVKERLPEDDRELMVYTDRYGGRQEFAYYVKRTEAWYQNCSLLIPNVTHWMLKPNAPEGE